MKYNTGAVDRYPSGELLLPPSSLTAEPLWKDWSLRGEVEVGAFQG
ncbi:hypothetical protein STIAU_3948 [Stigmatella aurantiaca DW4/3-1]|uniref:Uncharacterized protein n=1 Tax=Stigmatella aurantiaca (strain DW4/3-1) TaxID=378806 RepID=Q099B6_STIAD|nr:hypothetical protein STIAU_3948 [Stigmatella aurantiaca DW4/3-1]